MAQHHDDHSHDHSHRHHHGSQNLAVAFFLNLSFTIIEIAGGFFTNSIAILSDALHDLGDSLSLGLAWYFQKISKKGRDKQFSYGYKRFSLLGAIINSIVLAVGSIVIITEAVPRLLNPQTPNAQGMFLLAVLGIIFNGVAALRLKKGASINEKVVSLHLLEDVLGWVAVLIGSIVMYFFDLPIIDPILSLAIAAFILFNVYRNLKASLRIVLQAIPPETDINLISEQIVAIPEVQDVHDLHIWSLDGKYNILTAHVVLEKMLQGEAGSILKGEIRRKVKDLGIDHATIELERVGEECGLGEC